MKFSLILSFQKDIDSKKLYLPGESIQSWESGLPIQIPVKNTNNSGT